MKFRKIGTYRDETDSGLHLEAIGVSSEFRFQTVSRQVLDEETYRSLLHGGEVEIPFIEQRELLKAIAS